MEALSETERHQNGNLSRDTPHLTPEWIALEALVNKLRVWEDELGAA